MISFVLTIVLPVDAFAEDTEFLAQYSGSTTASYGYKPNCTFTIYDISNGRFRGNFSASNLGSYNVSQAVAGAVYDNYDSFTCVFSFTNYYNTSFVITVFPFDGYCECITSGSWHFEDFEMTGTRFTYNTNSEISGNSEFNENDLKMCMILSKMAYGKKVKNHQNVELKNCIEHNRFNLSSVNLKSYNYYTENGKLESDPDNVAFSITYRENNENNIDMVVVIRGSYYNEWIGNTEITGNEYNSQQKLHKNFNDAKDTIKAEIVKYIRDYLSSYQSINLIITGHSRGAAVANLYAKEATDVMVSGTATDVPVFNSVTAYTFACPNVEKYNSSMENYSSIFNFCLCEDLVPTVPLTDPEEGWNYWKYGLTYITDMDYKYFWNHSGIDNRNTRLSIYAIHAAFSEWKSIEEYYNKEIGEANDTTTLYNFLHTAATDWRSVDNKPKIIIRLRNLINNTKSYPEINKFLKTALIGIDSLFAHSTDFYEPKISNYNHTDRNGVNLFRRYTYQNCLYDFENKLHFSNNINNRNILRSNNVTYNQNEISYLTALYNQSDNSALLDWDITDPSTWLGITWNSSGNVTAIELPYLDLEGTLDLSDFSALESVNLAGNKLTSIDLTDCDSLINLNVSANNLTSLDVSDCTELETLDCSFNDLSTSGLDVSANTALTTLTCDDCGLTTLNVSALPALEELSCAFNELTTINIDSNTALTSLTCCYNYMDTHEGGTLYNKFDDLLFSDVYVNYYPQAIPDNATFNTSELNALKTFALTENNNAALDWLDENDNIDTDKLQNNVLFEYDGSKYRVVAVDIADTEVEGALNLTALTKLKELYCENTSITSLNVNGCTALNTLSCDNCEITSLTLPSNAGTKNTPLYDVSCEYNHINTSIFTTDIVNYITFKAGATLEYENQKWEDDSALAAVIEFSQGLNSEDYSESSFAVLSDLIDEYEDYENYLLTQNDIDSIVTDFLNAISDLEPYLKLKLSGDNGTVTTVYDGETQSGNTHSILFGESVTLTATPDTNYVFDGWYERITQRVYSTDSTYTFPMTTNLDFVARFVKQNAAILSFTNDTGQIVSKIDNTPTEWNDVTTLDDLLPDVPYKLGHVNGRWNYIESEVLTALRAGTDVTITPVYDESDYVYPEAPLPVDGNPVLNLTFTYDESNDIGSFIMGAGLPENLDIESMGIAFYFKNKNTFVPDNYILNINNKAVVSRFDNTVPDNRYIVNVHRFAEKYNWCARGFVTYRDDGVLKIAYSNQMNITNTVQNNRRIAISRSVENELPYHIDVIDDED